MRKTDSFIINQCVKEILNVGLYNLILSFFVWCFFFGADFGSISDISIELEHPSFDPPTHWSLDNLLYLLSYSRPPNRIEAKPFGYF